MNSIGTHVLYMYIKNNVHACVCVVLVLQRCQDAARCSVPEGGFPEAGREDGGGAFQDAQQKDGCPLGEAKQNDY